jgi:hypothetical protein
VAAGQANEVRCFACKHAGFLGQARRIVERCGPDRDKPNGDAKRLRGR